MFRSFMRRLCIVGFGFLAVLFPSFSCAQTNRDSSREVAASVKDTRGPIDRFFDLSIGSDYPGTLIQDDSQAQLKIVTAELGFRYIRFHAIFHDVLGTVSVVNGKTMYDWAKIDQLYDDLLARHIKPFVELGFTPNALATSQNSIFYWHGNTSPIRGARAVNDHGARPLHRYPLDSDWVFASPTMKGKQPYWPDNLLKRYIKPAAKKAGIHKNIGWHTFRHSFGTLLKANGEDVKTVQELLRHANSKITLDVSTQAVNSHKRAAQSKVVQMIVPGVGTNVGTKKDQARTGTEA